MYKREEDCTLVPLLERSRPFFPPLQTPTEVMRQVCMLKCLGLVKL